MRRLVQGGHDGAAGEPAGGVQAGQVQHQQLTVRGRLRCPDSRGEQWDDRAGPPARGRDQRLDREFEATSGI
uniref:hypothetical protein n=1 Tax=Paractinoplanes polyasparticus TaxID=2856853 RepID=UPI001C842A8C|nr:hypothetical protein [Actinoplanes polyasparticus]